MRKAVLIFSIMIMVFSFTGCTSITEVRDRAFIQAVGVDGDNEQSVAIRTFSKKEVQVCIGEGETVFSAMEDAEANQDKNLFIGHIENLVVSNGNLIERIGVIMKNNRITPSCNLIYSQGSAVNLVLDNDLIGILETTGSKERKSMIIERSMSDVMKEILSLDGAATLPVITDDTMVMGVIDENGLIGLFSDEESTGLCLLEGSVKDDVIPLETADGRNIDFLVKEVSTKVKTEIENGNVTARITLKVKGEKVEAEVSDTDVEKLLSDKITSMCEKAVTKSIEEFESDTFGLETSLKKYHPKFYVDNKENWDEILSNTKVFYKVELKT